MILLGIDVLIALQLYYGDYICYVVLHNQHYVLWLLVD